MKWEGTMWAWETLDGGVSDWLTSIRDDDGTERKLKVWRESRESGELPSNVNIAMPTDWKLGVKWVKGPVKAAGKVDKLHAQCQCGGVKFSITRPNKISKTAKSPFADLIVPYHSGSSSNPSNETWFLRCNDTKYLAGLCACPSCRHASGQEIQAWAFVPLCNILQEDGQPLDQNYDIGTLKRCESSPSVWREFCAACGASVFWHCEERPEIVDVAVGLLDSQKGARAEDWLEWWTERVSFGEMAVSKSLVEGLVGGLRQWGLEKSNK